MQEYQSKNGTSGYKMQSLIHVPSEKQKEWKTDFLIYRKLIYIGIFLNDRELNRVCLISTLESFCLWFPEAWMGNDSGWIGLAKWAELSFVCMTELVLSARGICKASLSVLILTNSNKTLPSLHSLSINTAYPKPSADSSSVACYSLYVLNCNSSAIPK